MAAKSRFDRLDALRAIAVLWMATFHFFFDLANFKLIQENFYRDPFWTVQRSVIVTMFLLCAGFGQAIAHEQQQDWRRFWKRWAQIAGCALLVSIGSWTMFPRSYITFGVLHGVAVMLVVVRLSAGWGRWLWPLGAIAIALPHFIKHPFFDTRLTNWVGLTTRKPVTEDWVPVLPWLGVMWLGVAIGQWVLANRREWVTGALPSPLRWLAVLGRWSLSFYMMHQPVFIGLILAFLWVRRSMG